MSDAEAYESHYSAALPVKEEAITISDLWFGDILKSLFLKRCTQSEHGCMTFLVSTVGICVHLGGPTRFDM